MPPTFTKDFSGTKNLKAIKADFKKDKTVHREAAIIVLDYQQANVPVKTGRLRDELHIVTFAKRGQQMARIQALLDYALPTELDVPYARPSIAGPQLKKIENSYVRRFNKKIKSHKI